MKRMCVLLACAAMLYAASGCGPSSAPAPTATPAQGPADDHGHSHGHGDAPHGGTLADWGGGEYHVEFTVDHDKKEATVYVLGGDAATPAPIAAESIELVIDDPRTEMQLVAQPLEGEPEGTSSRFVGTHDTIGIVKEFSGTIRGLIDGTPYTGNFKEEPHGADHKH
jgi:hypothetical protein